MGKNTKIIIVDDHVLFREGMKLLIENEGMGKVVAEAENGQVFLDQLKTHDPDLVLMDIEMPVMNGLEATRKSREMNPDLKILALTMLSRKESYTGMINAGAMGFVLKSSGKKELERAIKTVIDGESYFSNEILRQIIFDLGKQKPDPEKPSTPEIEFTDRELEILHYFCQGLTATEIANKICRSIKTIEAHRASLLEKTNTKNTINLVLYAIKNKLVDF